MFLFVCRKIGLLLALSYCKNMFPSLQRVTLIFTWNSQNNVFVCFRLSYAVFSIMFLTTAFSFFRTRTVLLTLYLTDNMLCFMQGSLNFISRRHCKYVNFYMSKIIIHHLDGLFGPKRGPAPSCLVSSDGRALHRYLRGHGFKFCMGLNFFQILFTATRFSSVLSCEDIAVCFSVGKYAAFTFTARKTCFGWFVGKSRFLQSVSSELGWVFLDLIYNDVFAFFVS